MNLFKLESKSILIILFAVALSMEGYSQLEIVKNGIKINRLDKKGKKQGTWFFFDENENIQLSCNYYNDSIISPLTFYENNDTAFIRFPDLNGVEAFILYKDNQQLVGNYRQISQDSFSVDFVGTFKPLSKDSIYLDTLVSVTSNTIDEVYSWFKKQILPVYMFGNANLTDNLYSKFRSSDYIFSKTIYAAIYIDESGKVNKVEFPREKNNVSIHEETELTHIFSGMQRWQPYFFGNKTCSYVKILIWNSTIRY